MSDKYSEMAKQVASEHDARRLAERQKSDAAQAAKDQRIDADIAALERCVLEELELARAAFATQNMIFAIAKHYDVRNRSVYVAPAISFHGQTAPRADDKYVGDCRRVFFSVRDGVLTARSSKEGFSREGDDQELGKAPIDSVGDVLSTAIRWALNAYHEDMEKKFWMTDKK